MFVGVVGEEVDSIVDSAVVSNMWLYAMLSMHIVTCIPTVSGGGRTVICLMLRHGMRLIINARGPRIPCGDRRTL